METTDLFSTGSTSAQVRPLERRVIFTDDISNVAFENIEIIGPHLRELSQKHNGTATVPGDQVHGNIVDLSATVQLIANTTKRHPTTTNSHISTVE